MYGIRQIRVTPLLDDGSADASAEAITSTMIQQIAMASVYIDGAEVIQRGGDNIKAVVKEDDTYRGENLTLDLAAVEPELKAAIVGGTVTDDKWEAPKDSTEMPYPFKLEAWQAVETESESESTQDGFIKHTFNYCKRGRLGSSNASQQSFTNEQYTVEARVNESDPSDIGAAWEHEEAAAIE